jgi:phage host-nuclease inhibitor protein Gam
MTSPKAKQHDMTPITTRAQAILTFAVLGMAQQRRTELESEMQGAVQEATKRFALKLESEDRTIEAAETLLTNWAEEERFTLLEGDSKTATLGVHQIQFRMKPPKISLRDVEKVIEHIKRLKFKHLFLRTKEEVNKEAMLAHPDKAERIPGVTVKRDEEEVILSPFALDGVA